MVEMGHKWGLLAIKLHAANRWEKAKNAHSEDAKNCSIYLVSGEKSLEVVNLFLQ